MASKPVDSKTVVKATRMPYVVPVDKMVRTSQIIILLIGFFAFLEFIRSPQNTTLPQWVVLTLYLAYTIYLQFHTSGLSIDTDGVHFVSLFRRKRKLPWTAIDSVVTGSTRGFQKGRKLKNVNSTRGTYVMIFSRHDGMPPFILNYKPYSVRGLFTLTHFIIYFASQANIDDRTRRITEGYFPSVFFAEQKGYG